MDFDKIWQFALQKHDGQKYGKEPYYTHLEAVANVCLELVYSKEFCEKYEWVISKVDINELKIVAVLHDIIEDTDCTEVDLAKLGVSTNCNFAVYLLTKFEGYDYDEYIENIKSNPLAFIVKVADTMHNLTTSLNQSNIKRVMKYNKQLALLLENKDE